MCTSKGLHITILKKARKAIDSIKSGNIPKLHFLGNASKQGLYIKGD
jgi:hypothetical protein